VSRKAALVAWVMGLALGAPALAGSTGTVTVTVTVQFLSISVTPSSDIAFGMVALDSKTVTAKGGNTVVVTNDGNEAEDFSIRVSAGTTATWILGTAGIDAVDVNTFTLCGRFVDSAADAPAEGDYAAGDVMTGSAKWCDGTQFGGKGHEVVATTGVCDLYFRLHAPTSVSGAGAGSKHSLTVEVGARQHTP